MSPHETCHLESTKKVEKTSVATSSFVKFELWDFPGVGFFVVFGYFFCVCVCVCYFGFF
jgi:hypothetical protein